jgi:hypothetical protein
MAEVVLTVADHEKNGFIALARWPFQNEAQARTFIAEQDAGVVPEAEPDIKTAPFTFILDLMTGPYEVTDNGKRLLPTQNAMALAPDQVRRWIDERPEPDDCIGRHVPLHATPEGKE